MKTLMIVDEPRMCQELSPMFAMHGFHILTAHSTEQALKDMSILKVGGVLVSLRFGREDGLELIRHMRRQYPHIPVIAMLTEEDVSYARECLRAGAADFIFKPPQVQDLEWIQVFFCPDEWHLTKVATLPRQAV